ncbi:hypothetical protein K9M79_07375 [Candidatus Woesearchaeota archaeon]|nr:hypothetical protein [Candidatus Woesearchaeota archaeon]
MKHNVPVTVLLILIFIMANLIGLVIIPHYIDIEKSSETGKSVRVPGSYEQVGLEPPEVENESYSFFYISIAIAIGTAIALLIIKYKKILVWKVWLFIAVSVCLVIALNPFISKLDSYMGDYSIGLTIALAIGLSFFKVFKKNIWIHNLTEIFIYGGVASILVFMLNFTSALVVLILVSIYDIYAVNKSKHMVTMAKFQASNQLFPGLMIPYKSAEHGSGSIMAPEKKSEHNVHSKPVKKTTKKTHNGVHETVRSAILGGGDITFPLLFAGTILKTTGVFMDAFIVVIFAAAALAYLFYIGDKNKFYPAMPYLTVGCLIGYFITQIF